MAVAARIAPCLWFDNQAEEAAKYYVGIFKKSKIISTTHYSDAGQETHHKKPGTVLTVMFDLDGTRFTTLNGGPNFKFNEAISLQIFCETQDEIDYYWNKLGAGGDPAAQVCGWLKDRYGVSWQVVPTIMDELIQDAESPGAKRVMESMMKMKKIDIEELRRAYEGEAVGAGR